jgi:hypothetical protein
MNEREVLIEQLMHLIQGPSHTDSVRRSRADYALHQFLDGILDVGVVALDEEQAVAAYSAGSNAIDKVLQRIANEANRTAARGCRSRGRG